MYSEFAQNLFVLLITTVVKLLFRSSKGNSLLGVWFWYALIKLKIDTGDYNTIDGFDLL